MKIPDTPILLMEDDQAEFMRSIDAYWTISVMPQ